MLLGDSGWWPSGPPMWRARCCRVVSMVDRPW